MTIRKIWSYDDDLICCMEYLCFALRESPCRTLQELIDTLSVKLPHISKGSIRMKLQNIKQVSLNLGLEDGVNIPPLDQYSRQCKTAFQQAVAEAARDARPLSIEAPQKTPNRSVIVSEDPDDFLDIFLATQDYLNELVLHARFGEGTISRITPSHITVTFAQKNVRFIYPDAFKNFLQFKNKRLQTRMDDFFHHLYDKDKPPHIL